MEKILNKKLTESATKQTFDALIPAIRTVLEELHIKISCFASWKMKQIQKRRIFRV